MHRRFRRSGEQIGRDRLEVGGHLVLLGYSASLGFPRWFLLGRSLLSALQLLLPPEGRVNEMLVIIFPTVWDLIAIL